LRAKFVGARDATLQDSLSEFLLAGASQALECWFGSACAGTLLRDPDALRGALDRDIAAIDALVSDQVDAILHHERLRRLEGTWRGVAWLVDVVDQSSRLKIKVLNVGWNEICRDLERAI